MEGQNRNVLLALGLILLVAVLVCCCLLVAITYFLPRSTSGFNLNFGPGIESTATLAETVTVSVPATLEIDNPVGTITVRAVEGDEMTLKATTRVRASSQAQADDLLRLTRIEASPTEDGLTIKVDRPNVSGNTQLDVNLVVEVPANTHLTTGLGVGDLSVTGVTGMINADVGVGEINVIGVSLAEGSTIKAGVGDLRFQGLIPDTGGLDFGTEVGSVSLTLPADSPYCLDARTGVGRISDRLDRFDAERSRQDLVGETLYGCTDPDAELLIQVHTGTGDINLR